MTRTPDMNDEGKRELEYKIIAGTDYPVKSLGIKKNYEIKKEAMMEEAISSVALAMNDEAKDSIREEWRHWMDDNLEYFQSTKIEEIADFFLSRCIPREELKEKIESMRQMNEGNNEEIDGYNEAIGGILSHT